MPLPDAPDAAAPEVEPHRSLMSAVNAELSVDRVFADKFEDVPEALALLLTSWLFARS